MVRNTIKFLIIGYFVIAFLFLANLCYADTAKSLKELKVGSTYYVTLKDGSKLHGKLIRNLDSEIAIKNPAIGEIAISKNNIKEIIETSETLYKKGKYWFPNPNYSRYLIGPSAIPMKKGEGYYQNTMIIINSVGFGITDFFSLGAGIEFISTIAGNPAFFINPKLTFSYTDNLHFGAGIFYANAIGKVMDFGGLGFTNAMLTYGNKNNNLTLGLGWGYVESDFSDEPIISLSGMARVSPGIGFITENWFVPIPDDKYEIVFSYGIRFMGEKLAFDLSFINHVDIAKDVILGFPFVSFVFNF